MPLTTSAEQVWELISSIGAESVELTTISDRNMVLEQQLNLPDNFDKLTPTGKTNALAALGPSAPGLTDFMDSQDRADILRGLQGSLRPVGSGIANYAKFRSAAQANPFPAIPLTIRRRVETFNCGNTYGLYVNQVKKASLLL